MARGLALGTWKERRVWPVGYEKYYVLIARRGGLMEYKATVQWWHGSWDWRVSRAGTPAKRVTLWWYSVRMGTTKSKAAAKAAAERAINSLAKMGLPWRQR